MTLSTHVLDIARGRPAAGIKVSLYALEGGERALIAHASTNDDGRTDEPIASDLAAGSYELVFAVADYFDAHATEAFFDEIPIRFVLAANGTRYHVPLLLSAWGYSTYRGS